ncbi:T9SS type A sorting domain-containing protein [bacterium]|nr:T9SS type A sorting domain-containing protein [bacterium]
MKTKTLTRKLAKLNRLSEKLSHELSYEERAPHQIGGLVLKIKQLVAEVRRYVSIKHLQKALGVAAMLVGLGFGSKAHAQLVFQPVKENPFGIDTAFVASAPAFVDLDGDGDLDIMMGELSLYSQGQTRGWKYFENVGTKSKPKYTTPLSNPFGLDTIGLLNVPTFADFDNDGDYDLLSGNMYYLESDSNGGMTGRLLYFENIGSSSTPNFAAPVANPFGADTTLYYSLPTVADLDDDGDFDVLVGEYYGNMEYFENIGDKSSPKFAAPVDLPYNMNHVYQVASPQLADFDGDGDYDLLVSNYYGKFTYFENTGSKSSPNFAKGVDDPFKMNLTGSDTVDTYFNFPRTADIDDDGDLDVFIGGIRRAIRFYEQGITSGISPIAKSFEIYPNPSNGVINIMSNDQFDRVEVIDFLGKTQMVVNGNVNQISIGQLQPGTYILKLSNDQGEFAVKQITKM